MKNPFPLHGRLIVLALAISLAFNVIYIYNKYFDYQHLIVLSSKEVQDVHALDNILNEYGIPFKVNGRDFKRISLDGISESRKSVEFSVRAVDYDRASFIVALNGLSSWLFE